MYHLRRAIDYFGSQQKLAERIGVRQTTISYWLIQGCLPPEHALRIERVTGKYVMRHELLPDLFRGYTRNPKKPTKLARKLKENAHDSDVTASPAPDSMDSEG